MKPLTPYQKKAYVEDAEVWKHSVVLNTRPVDRSRAEEAVVAVRKALGHNLRPSFRWFQTPVQCMAFIATSEASEMTRKVYLSDEMTPYLKWSDQEITLSAIVRKTLGPIETCMRFNHADPFTYHSIRMGMKKVGGYERNPDEIFKPESCQFTSDLHKFRFAKERLGLNIGHETCMKIDLMVEVARSCCLWWNHRNVVVMSERPTTIGLDEHDRFHSLSGPALAYGETFKKYMVHNVEVEADIVKDPVNSITPLRIEAEHNAEVRRTLLDIYGSDRYLRQTGAQIIHEGRHGRRLWWRMPRKSIVRRGREADSIFGGQDEPLVMVEVKNSTPEPDGSIKTYFLRVPPTMRDANAAVAWTFGLSLEEYEPQKET